MKSTLFRTLGLLSAGVMVATTPTVAVAATPPTLSNAPIASPAAASHSCTFQDAEHLRVKRWVTLKSHKYAITHADRVRLEAGASFKRTRSVTFTKQWKASISGSVEAHTEAGAFFAKASVTVKASVSGEKGETETTSVSDEFIVPARKHATKFVFYMGNDYFKMRWHRLQCRLPHGELKSGKLNTFALAKFSGVVRCPHSRYRPGSEAYVASLAGGC